MAKKEISEKEIDLSLLNERQRKAIGYLKERGSITRREYVSIVMNLSLRQANKDLKDLVEKNLIVQIGKGRSVKYVLHD